MKAVDTLSAKDLGVSMTPGFAFFELVPTNEPPRADGDRFANAFRTAVLRARRKLPQASKLQVIGKSIDSGVSTAWDGNFLSRLDEKLPVRSYWESWIEAAHMGFVGTAEPFTQPLQAFFAGTNETVALHGGVDTGEFAGDILPAVPRTAESNPGVLQEGMYVPTSGEALHPDGVPLPPEQWIKTDDLVIGSTPGERQRPGGLMVDDTSSSVPVSHAIGQSGDTFQRMLPMPKVAASAKGNSDAVLGNVESFSTKDVSLVVEEGEAAPAVNALFPSMTASIHEGALLDSGSWNGSFLERSPDSDNAALPNVSFDRVFQQISAEQPLQAASVNLVEAGYEGLFNQVVQGVRLAQRAETGELHVHLKPEFLGRLSIRVLARDQSVNIEIRVENEVVRQVMQDNLADLQQRLAEKGFAFNQITLLADMGLESGKQPAWPCEPSGFRGGAESEDTVEDMAVSVSLPRSGIIDLLV